MSIPYGTLRDIANELKNIREILEKQSTTEQLTTEQSLKVGKWIADGYCSECEWDKKDVDYTSEWRENYCPNCGARMKGADNGIS